MAEMNVSGKPVVKVRFYRLRNRLKEKTAGIGNAQDQQTFIDEVAL